MLIKSKFVWMLFLASFIFIFTNVASPHCDSMEGPVVKASQKALETGNINYVLVWVRAEDENEIKDMFDKVNKVRVLSDEAKELADMYFFETVVRIHRMGEGVGYTGLIPAGYKPEEGIEAADIAIEKNNVSEILAHLEESQHSNVKEYFTDLQSKKNFDVDDVAAGRKYVESYVHFIHYVESLYSGDMEQTEEHMHNH
ncbi:MAG: DUF6448 family protein [Ignavibacteriaceae bacterium]